MISYKLPIFIAISLTIIALYVWGSAKSTEKLDNGYLYCKGVCSSNEFNDFDGCMNDCQTCVGDMGDQRPSYYWLRDCMSRLNH